MDSADEYPIIFGIAAGLHCGRAIVARYETAHGFNGLVGRVISDNSIQLGITVFSAGQTWNRWLNHWSVTSISETNSRLDVGNHSFMSFRRLFHYWWQSIRHESQFLWRPCTKSTTSAEGWRF